MKLFDIYWKPVTFSLPLFPFLSFFVMPDLNTHINFFKSQCQLKVAYNHSPCLVQYHQKCELAVPLKHAILLNTNIIYIFTFLNQLGPHTQSRPCVPRRKLLGIFITSPFQTGSNNLTSLIYKMKSQGARNLADIVI